MSASVRELWETVCEECDLRHFDLNPESARRLAEGHNKRFHEANPFGREDT